MVPDMLDYAAARSIEVNGTALATFDKGQGDALVFVHGSASDARTWSNQIDTFSDRFRTIAYSRRYHVPNDPIPADAPDPIQAHVDDLVSLIGALEAGPAHVVGHSWGGLVSLLAARQEPGLIRSLVLIEPPVISMHVSIPPKPDQLIRLLFSRPKLAIAILKFGGGTVGPSATAFRRGDDKEGVDIFARGVLGDRHFRALSDERYRQVWENRGPDRALALFHGFPELMGVTFSDLHAPALLLRGADSPALFGLLIESLQERLPDARLQVIENASHVVHEDAPEALNRTIEAFLSAIG